MHDVPLLRYKAADFILSWSDDTCHIIATHCHELAKFHFDWKGQANLDEFVRFVRKIHVLTHVKFSQSLFSRLNDETLSVLAASHQGLQKIALSNCVQITDDGMTAIAEGCPRLVSVVCRTRKNISDRTLFALATACPDLAKLDFSFTGITDAGIVMVAEKCHRLRYLDVRSAQYVTREGVKKVWALRPYCEVMHTTRPTQDEISCLISRGTSCIYLNG